MHHDSGTGERRGCAANCWNATKMRYRNGVQVPPAVNDQRTESLGDLIVTPSTGAPSIAVGTAEAEAIPRVTQELVVKSRHRVKTYGEVFTPRRMVDRMLDLVREELETGPDFVDKTFLEPAAGDGNFLVAILHRKLRAIENRYQPERWPDESLFALASIYGIELLHDNHQGAQEAMLAEFVRFHRAHKIPIGPRTKRMRAAQFLVGTNIVQGDTITGRDWRGEPITFSWWNRVSPAPDNVHREPFTLASLREANELDFAVHGTYAVCRIDRVHEEVKDGD